MKRVIVYGQSNIRKMSKEEKDSYLHDVFKEVDDILEKDGIGIIWDYDPLNIYMTI